MNTEFTMIGFKNYNDKELELIEQKRTNRLGYKTSNYKSHGSPAPKRDLKPIQDELEKEVRDKMIELGANHRPYWIKWSINTGAGTFKTPEDVIDGRIGQRQAIIDYLVGMGIDQEKFNNVSLENLRKMAIRAGA